ncbi:MAG: Lrp/AsnC family transcriptional regulator [Acidobacteriota bacterium]|jgi:DNA-binding Lrp family transcriptional regulator
MVTTVVLLNVKSDRINEVAQKILDIHGVTEVYSVAGRYDLVVMVRTKGTDELAEVVTNEMLKVQGITHSETLTAFRVYSHHDLERMFAIGLEGSSGDVRVPH